jgi:hypothetical protein
LLHRRAQQRRDVGARVGEQPGDLFGADPAAFGDAEAELAAAAAQGMDAGGARGQSGGADPV